MNNFEILTLILSALTVLIIPLLVLVVRSAVRWGHMEDKISGLADDIRTLVADKDRTHDLIYQQMREDRVATNKRLTWLEQNLWRRNDSQRDR